MQVVDLLGQAEKNEPAVLLFHDSGVVQVAARAGHEHDPGQQQRADRLSRKGAIGGNRDANDAEGKQMRKLRHADRQHREQPRE